MVTIWGFNFVVIRWGLNDIPPLLLTLMRFVLAAFPAVLFVAPPKAPARLIVGYGLFAFALQFSLLFGGMAVGMPTGLASLVIQIQAFFTIGMVALLMHERPRPAQFAAALVAALGLALVAWHLPQGTALGFVLVLLAALSWAIANVIVKRVPADAPLAVVVWGSAAACVPLAVATLWVEGPQRIVSVVSHLGLRPWLGVAFQAWPTTLVAFGIWAWLLRRHAAAIVAPFTLLVPVVGMSCAAWFLGEPVTWWKLAGGALVLGGLALNLAAARRR